MLPGCYHWYKASCCWLTWSTASAAAQRTASLARHLACKKNGQTSNLYSRCVTDLLILTLNTANNLINCNFAFADEITSQHQQRKYLSLAIHAMRSWLLTGGVFFIFFLFSSNFLVRYICIGHHVAEQAKQIVSNKYIYLAKWLRDCTMNLKRYSSDFMALFRIFWLVSIALST